MMPTSMPADINKYFYDRKIYTRRINSYLTPLNDNISNQLLITGAKGVGKTFLLKKLLKDQPKNFITIYN